jgi:hypothetical protein
MNALLGGFRSLSPALLAVLAMSLLGMAIASAPVLLATLSVAFLAGPHNLMEARYLLSRLPGRVGKLRPYFLLSLYGVLTLGLTSVALPFFSGSLGLRVWNTILIGWVTALAMLRRRENPRRDWPWLEPVALALTGWMWAYPGAFTLLLVFGHPILALVILGKELHTFRRPERHIYQQLMAAVPVGLVVLLYGLHLRGWAGPDEIRSFLTLSSGSPLFLAAHTYFELLHYAVWIGALPLLASATRRQKLELFPALKKSSQRLLAARLLLALGLVIAGLLWWGFTADFETTRDLYFRIAIFHVLVEFPFLVRLL